MSRNGDGDHKNHGDYQDRVHSINKWNPFQEYNLYGWRPDPSLSDDENYMDLVMLVTRSSILSQGSMACILVKHHVQRQQRGPDAIVDLNAGRDEDEVAHRDENMEDIADADHDYHDASPHQLTSSPSSISSPSQLSRRLFRNVISVATNAPFYAPHESDIHAEIAAIGKVVRNPPPPPPPPPPSSCNSTVTSAYITMPPCKRCLAALYAAGVGRIVTRLSEDAIRNRDIGKMWEIARNRGMEWVGVNGSLGEKGVLGVRQRERVDRWVKAWERQQQDRLDKQLVIPVATETGNQKLHDKQTTLYIDQDTQSSFGQPSEHEFDIHRLQIGERRKQRRQNKNEKK